MAAIKRHTCTLNPKLLKQIEYVLPKLKYSVYVEQIIKWLENFEESEVDLALDFLFYIEYLSFSELQMRIHEQLKRIVKKVGEVPMLLIPYAPYPKSNDLIMYLLTKTEIYKQLEKENRISYTRDVETYSIKKQTVLVYVDDFIGTGNSFKKWYNKNDLVNLLGKNYQIRDEQFLLAAVVMEEGKQLLNQLFPDIIIYAEIRTKLFSHTNSPFNLTNSRTAMRRLCLKYGNQIPVDFVPPDKQIFRPLGYDKSEALIAFDYGTPNNTLSIIWGDNKWTSIFPRFAKGRMNKAKAVKIEASFYLGIMSKLGIELNEDHEVTIGAKSINYNSRDDYSVFVLVLLKEQKLNDIQICQILGVTFGELKKIYSKAKEKKLINAATDSLTRLSLDYLKVVKSNSTRFKFRESDPLESKSKTVPVPLLFDGKT